MQEYAFPAYHVSIVVGYFKGGSGLFVQQRRPLHEDRYLSGRSMCSHYRLTACLCPPALCLYVCLFICLPVYLSVRSAPLTAAHRIRHAPQPGQSVRNPHRRAKVDGHSG